MSRCPTMTEGITPLADLVSYYFRSAHKKRIKYMPKVTAQSNKPKPPPVIKQPPAFELFTGFKLNVYGRGKTGKTRLACSFPKPMLLIGTEDGTKSIATGRVRKGEISNRTIVWSLTLVGKPMGIDFIRIQNTDEMDDILDLLKHPQQFFDDQPSYFSCALDHGSGFQNLIVKEFLGLDEVPNQRSWGMMKQEQWGGVNNQFMDKIGKLLDLPEKTGLNVVIIAHERNFKDENTSSDIMTPSIASALTPGCCTWLNGACDYICQCFIRQHEEYKETPLKDGKVLKTRIPNSSKPEFCLRIGPHGVYHTGFRHVGDSLPDVIVNPSYEKVCKLIQGIPID